MIVLLRHHDNNPTIIFTTGNHTVRVVNGCQDFEARRLVSTCARHRVKEQHVESAKEAIRAERAGEGEPFADFVNHWHCSVRACVATYGSDEVRAQMANETHWRVLELLARHGNDELRDKLVVEFAHAADDTTGNWRTRRAAAQYGSDELRTRLIKDTNTYVRTAVARFGNDAHREQLADDEDADVRAVAMGYRP